MMMNDNFRKHEYQISTNVVKCFEFTFSLSVRLLVKMLLLKLKGVVIVVVEFLHSTFIWHSIDPEQVTSLILGGLLVLSD